jgi:DNA-binding MarR family transcriptional regulator
MNKASDSAGTGPRRRGPTGESAGRAAALDEGALQRLLGYNLAQASIATSRIFRRRIAPLGLTQVEFTVLMLLLTNAEVTQGQLGRTLGAAPSNLTNLLTRLEGKGLIERSRSRRDARAQVIALTRRGEALARKAAAASEGMEEPLLKHLSAGERAMLVELLLKVARLRNVHG